MDLIVSGGDNDAARRLPRIFKHGSLQQNQTLLAGKPDTPDKSLSSVSTNVSCLSLAIPMKSRSLYIHKQRN
ncbi:hypothetical protein Smp_133960 [Schistosoma mansoni]|uniref:hypothetical protein n=1 Tax=Schistosoma mansoni TaxID=6183 RepID=UPI0001A63B9D|nr:hypothetical protein Smp_133960 [Schistosoma mansoni]|eukprot:XP_018649662.1 hypothetical protein Smp_133960 [Schistosoma mansoni]